MADGSRLTAWTFTPHRQPEGASPALYPSPEGEVAQWEGHPILPRPSWATSTSESPMGILHGRSSQNTLSPRGTGHISPGLRGDRPDVRL